MTSFQNQLKIMSVMKKPKLGSNNAHKTPEHVIVDNILPRLPVKSLLRFKTVCKTWFDSFSTTAFQKSHFRFSSSASKFLLFHASEDRKIFLLSYDESKTTVSDLVQLDSNILSKQSNEFSPVGSCNGVWCWNLEDLDFFVVWNPATHQHKTIPGCSQTVDADFTLQPGEFSLERNGFGYVSSTNDYKIFAMYLSLDIDRFGCFYLFSLNTGKWKRLDFLDGTYYVRALADMDAVYMDDTMYWPFRNQDTWTLGGIIGFNLVTDQMNPVQQISWLCNYSSVDQIFKIRGCLSLCCRNDRDLVSDIWMLEQQGGLKTWSKLFSIDRRITPTVVDFTENGKYLVQHLGQLKLIDPNEQDTDLWRTGVDYDDDICQPANNKYVESLFSF